MQDNKAPSPKTQITFNSKMAAFATKAAQILS